jgi:hypothetical protein
MRARGLRRALLRLPHRGDVVRAAPSAIAGTGLFVLRDVTAGEAIGALTLGAAGLQGAHTLLVGTQHRVVEAPWRFINHACAPTATLHIDDEAALLFAQQDLRAYTELTIDYKALPEEVGTAFECHCALCVATSSPSRIGT